MNPTLPWMRRRRRLNSLLGLALDGQNLRGVVLQRVNGAFQPSAPFGAALSIDLLGAEPELAGREILNLLESAGVSERRCAVAVPLKWVLTAETHLPELPEADALSLLDIEIERAFPCDADTLQVAVSRGALVGGEHWVTLIGAPKTHIEKLTQVLKAAGLTPVSFSLGITALQPPSAPGSDGVIALALGDDRVDLQATAFGGIVSLRALDGVTESEDAGPVLQCDRVAREVRITLAQLPPAVAASLRRIHIYGPAATAGRLADELRQRLGSGGVAVQWVGSCRDGASPGLPDGLAPSAEAGLAAQVLSEGASPVELLPPRISAWQRFAAKYSTGGLKSGGLAAAGAVALVVGLFGIQQWRLNHWNSEWRQIEPKARQLGELQAQIRKYRPWYDHSFACLSILKELTKAFPEDGSVTARTLEIRELDLVTCSGTCKDLAALLATVSRLRADPHVSDLTYEQIRGKTPMPFTFNLRWNPGAQSEN